MQEIVNIQDKISTEEENAELTQMFVKGKYSLKKHYFDSYLFVTALKYIFLELLINLLYFIYVTYQTLSKQFDH